MIIVCPVCHISHSYVENCCGFDRGQRLIITSLLQSFYTKSVTKRFFYMLGFLHFGDSTSEADKIDESIV